MVAQMHAIEGAFRELLLDAANRALENRDPDRRILADQGFSRYCISVLRHRRHLQNGPDCRHHRHRRGKDRRPSLHVVK